MLLIDGPSQFAPLEKWEGYLKHLDNLCPHDETVISEKFRAAKIIDLLKNSSIENNFKDINIPD